MPFFIFIIGCLYIIFKKLIIYISYIAISPTLYINASFSNTLYQGIFSNNLPDRVFINHAVNIPDDFFIYELSNVLAIPLFLHTLPVWGATCFPPCTIPLFGISIHALLAESDSAFQHFGFQKFRISIHALHAESDAFPMH